MLTFKRLGALAQIINRYNSYLLSYKCTYPDDMVVVIISFDLLNEMRAKCVHKMWLNENGAEFFMGCKIFMSTETNYLAVAYLNELDDKFHDIIEITEEETT
jgi:hypothetical protein